MNRFIISFFLIVFSVGLNAQLRFNEIKNQCETNFGCLLSGNWIELYNQSNETFETSLFFTNTKSNLKKWPLVNQNQGKVVFPPNQYLVIGVNESSNYSQAEVFISDEEIDTLYLVGLVKGEYIIIDLLVCNDDVFAINETSSTGIVDGNWKVGLLATPSLKNMETPYSTSKRRMEFTFIPFGVSNISLIGNPGQKNKPIYSFGVGFRRTRRMLKVFDFQYGLSVYRIGYNASYSTNDSNNGKERNTSSTLTSRGVRAAIDVKLGLPITSRFTFYSGLELGFVNLETIKTHTDVTITFPDGSMMSYPLDSETTDFSTATYLLGIVFEGEYEIKKSISISLKYISRKEFKQDTDIQTRQWNVMAGVNWRFWSSRKTAPKWRLL